MTKKQIRILSMAVRAIYFGNKSGYLSALWGIVDVLGGKEATDLLEEDSTAAYNKYCQNEIIYKVVSEKKVL